MNAWIKQTTQADDEDGKIDDPTRRRGRRLLARLETLSSQDIITARGSAAQTCAMETNFMTDDATQLDGQFDTESEKLRSVYHGIKLYT